MRSFTIGIVASALALALVIPSAASAASLTSDQINSIIGLLQSFGASTQTVSTVQAVLNHTPVPTASASENSGVSATHTEEAPSPAASDSGQPPAEGQILPPGPVVQAPSCLTLPRNLGVGAQGDDVKELQKMLAQDSSSGFTASPTGYFGPQTAGALARFQKANGIASTTAGFAGSLTRGFFERHCKPIGTDEHQGDTSGTMMDVISGTVTTHDGSTITVQTLKGESRTVTITSATTIQVFSTVSVPPKKGSAADLVVGAKLAVQGVLHSDGSITATDIKIGDLAVGPPPAKAFPGDIGQ